MASTKIVNGETLKYFKEKLDEKLNQQFTDINEKIETNKKESIVVGNTPPQEEEVKFWLDTSE